MNTTFPWQNAYLDAVLETDNSTLPQRIVSAENAIKARTIELAQDHYGTPAERQAISEALNGLDRLRWERSTTMRRA